MTDEERWAGKFGDEYHERNDMIPRRWDFWCEFYKKYSCEKVLEVGCGRASNLLFMPSEIIGYGIDVNWDAIYEARRLDEINPIYGCATDIPFKDNFFDLVFTCGLLIHIPPDDLLRVMSEMVRCSRKYVMMMEYAAEKEEKIKYREGVGLWKRPYKDLFFSSFSRSCYIKKWQCIDEGYLGKDDGFDNITWWLFERK